MGHSAATFLFLIATGLLGGVPESSKSAHLLIINSNGAFLASVFDGLVKPSTPYYATAPIVNSCTQRSSGTSALFLPASLSLSLRKGLNLYALQGGGCQDNWVVFGGWACSSAPDACFHRFGYQNPTEGNCSDGHEYANNFYCDATNSICPTEYGCTRTNCNEENYCNMTYEQYTTVTHECMVGGGVWMDYPDCYCSPGSPIVVDVMGNGYSLTSVKDGVRFRINPNGAPLQMAWTSNHSDDSFLVLDRNGNGVVDDGSELFGNYTPQPNSDHKNGYDALGVFDSLANGGNGDGVIDAKDAIFSRLRLWRDSNHNGISEPSELSTLSANGIESISLDYRENKRRDRYGNLFRYRSKINEEAISGVNRWTYDIFFKTEQIQWNTLTVAAQGDRK